MDDMAAAAVTLRDHVGEQIAFAFADPAKRLIARELAENLDDDGYMRADIAEIAARLGARPDDSQRGALRSARPSSLRGFSLAISQNALRCSFPSATGSIRRCRPC